MTNRRFDGARVVPKAAAAAMLLTGALCVAAAALPATAARAEDVALCVGVNRYPHLRPGANLNGCVNDAEIFAKKLTAYGVAHPVILADATATKGNILAQLAALRARVKPGDRVIFYFAGHGTIGSSGESVLLPSDAEDASESHDMQVADLYNAVKAFGVSVQKTIVLDSCHSGGMVRAVDRKWHDRRARFYVRSGQLDQKAAGFRTIKRWQEADNNGADDLSSVVHDKAPAPPVLNASVTPTAAASDPPIKGQTVEVTVPPVASAAPAAGTICYFTAAQKNEVANETEVGGETHGLFTYYLVNSLHGKGDLWKDITAAVSGKVADATDNEQKPQLFPSAQLDRVVFGGGEAPQPKPFNLDAVYNLSNPDREAVVLRRFPEQSPVAVGSKNYFQVTVRQDGYLVLIGRDPDNNLDILFPRKATRGAMEVHAGATLRLPSKETAFEVPDAAGTDNVKAILFASAEAAEAMLKPFEEPAANAATTGRAYKSLSVQAAKRAWKDTELPETPEASPAVAPAPAATPVVGAPPKASAPVTPPATKPTPAAVAPAVSKPQFYTSEITTLIVPREEAAH